MRLKLSVFILVICSLILPGKTNLSLNIAYNNYSGIFKDIYNNTILSYGIGMSFNVFKAVELNAGAEYFSTSGKLSYTNEETSFSLIPLEVGIRIPFEGKISPFIGAGGGIYIYNEKNNIGTAGGSGFGFYGEGGLRIFFGKMFLMFSGKYTLLNINDTNLNNIKGIIGFGVSF